MAESACSRPQALECLVLKTLRSAQFESKRRHGAPTLRVQTGSPTVYNKASNLALSSVAALITAALLFDVVPANILNEKRNKIL